MCGAGDQFALFEAVVALAMLIRRFEFSLDPEAPPVGMTTVSTHYACCYAYVMCFILEGLGRQLSGSLAQIDNRACFLSDSCTLQINVLLHCCHN